MSSLERTMSSRLPLLVTLVLVSLVPRPVRPATEPDWSYSDQAGWSALAAQCGGDRQSPVDLTVSEQRYWQDGGMPQLQFAKGLKAGQITAKNDGRTLKVTLRPDSDEPAVRLKGTSPGPLSGTYALDNLHLHWNNETDGRGSEHKMNGMFEAAEAHFVFYNEQYGSVSAALEEADGLAVVGLLLRPEPPASPRPGLAMPTFGLEDDLASLAALGSSVTRQQDLRQLRPLLRAAIAGLLTYDGSLTTPPCSPAVTWLVCDRTVSVEASFLQQLRTGLDANAAGTETVEDNWRELQELDGRAVVSYTLFMGPF